MKIWKLVLLLLVGGCVNPAPQVDAAFGQAVNAAKARQTLNPQASTNPDPVAGIDGKAATDSIERYNASFKAPPPTFTIINAAPAGQ
jgi:ribosomal protein L11